MLLYASLWCNPKKNQRVIYLQKCLLANDVVIFHFNRNECCFGVLGTSDLVLTV